MFNRVAGAEWPELRRTECAARVANITRYGGKIVCLKKLALYAARSFKPLAAEIDFFVPPIAMCGRIYSNRPEKSIVKKWQRAGLI